MLNGNPENPAELLTTMTTTHLNPCVREAQDEATAETQVDIMHPSLAPTLVPSTSAPTLVPSANTTYCTSFESGFEGWTTSTFYRHSGSTTTPYTGPSSAYDGSYYVYAETSSPHYPGVEFSMYLDLGEATLASVSFYYSMHGATMGTALLQGINRLGNSTTLWSKSGDQGDVWYSAQYNTTLPTESFQLLRFEYTSGSPYTGDFALDFICYELW
mmetsp:Transcript_83436/g.235236  ORF Transcript_83436/g.235236 Transcript_83436/m.235236 type:complete len:215 (-) Transcript_83436:119-763(-)